MWVDVGAAGWFQCWAAQSMNCTFTLDKVIRLPRRKEVSNIFAFS